MTDLYEKENFKGYTICIYRDEYIGDPIREELMAATFACFHRRYRLGHDNVEQKMLDDLGKPEFDGTIPELADALEKEGAEVAPLYLYDHSGITISTGPFNCPWDSGQLGVVYMTKKQMRETYCVKRVTKKIREKARALIESEVKFYDDYLVYGGFGYTIKDPDGNEMDSLWGFYGGDFEKNGLLAEAKSEIEWYVTQARRKHQDALKHLIKSHVPLIYREQRLSA